MLCAVTVSAPMPKATGASPAEGPCAAVSPMGTNRAIRVRAAATGLFVYLHHRAAGAEASPGLERAEIDSDLLT